MKENLFFVVSGEHPTLPHAEIRSILEAHQIEFEQTAQHMKLLRLRAEPSSLDAVNARSLMFEECGVEIFDCPAGRRALRARLSETDFSKFVEPKQTFAVRTLRVAGSSRRIMGGDLRKDVGRAILQGASGVSVHLDKPTKIFTCVLYDGRLLCGLVSHTRKAGLISTHRPRKRPVFHPSTMQPRLARCMVNLARPPRGALLVDPFCGVGGILLEAYSIGCEAIGMDADPRMTRGAKENLRYFGVHAPAVVTGDARSPPLHKADCIATDPPYGREASTLGSSTRRILKEFFPVAHVILRSGTYLSISCPTDIDVEELGRDAGFNLVESHSIYVHRSLTRRVAVLRRGP